MSKQLIKSLGQFPADKYPPVTIYSELLNYITTKESIDINTARSKYGQFSTQEWIDLIN